MNLSEMEYCGSEIDLYAASVVVKAESGKINPDRMLKLISKLDEWYDQLNAKRASILTN